MLPAVAASLSAVVLALGPSPAPGATGPVPAPALGPPPSAQPPAAPGTGWAAPIAPPVVVVRPFSPPAHPWSPAHRGVDLAAEVGDLVRSAGAGTVTWAGPLAGRGVVVVAHPDGRRTTYEPVRAAVEAGDAVQRGEVLGTVDTGEVHCGGPSPCLHWGLRRGTDYLDPLLLLRRGHAVLLP